MTVRAPSATAAAAAAERLAGLATPPGALGRLGELAVWLAAVQDRVPPRPIRNARLVIFAGDHGVAAHQVSAFPPQITTAMVQVFLAGGAGVNALARVNGVAVRVLDLGVDDDFADLPDEVRNPLQLHKIRRSSGAIHLQDALGVEETEAALAAGAAVAAEEIAAGADLLLAGDMGIGNTTCATAMIAGSLGASPAALTGRGTGIDDERLRHKQQVVEAALTRAGKGPDDPVTLLAALSSADLAATVGYLLAAARAGIPVVLDGLMSAACAVVADRIEPGAARWFVAGHRSTEPAQAAALAHLGLVPLLDLQLRLGEGSGAVLAVPLLNSAVAVLTEVVALADLPPAPDR